MAEIVLIVDDTPANLQVLGQILKGKGYEVIAALNGKDAITALRKRADIDLVLLDVMMPEMDGFETCRRIKERTESKNIPVIFLTARTETADIVEGFAAGGVDYVTKPFNSEELLARVRTHVELKKAREELMTLRGIIPICSSCHSIRDDSGYWERVDVYMAKHGDLSFSHGICPSCMQKLYPEFAEDTPVESTGSRRSLERPF